MKEEDRIWLWVYALIGVVAAAVTGWCLCQNRQEFWQIQARSAFRVALQKEMQKWKKIDVYYYEEEGFRRLPDDSIYLKKEPMKVPLENEHGPKTFEVPYAKYSLNIASDSEKVRMMHSYLLHESPLNVDSLNLFWKEQLDKVGFSGRTVVRMVVSDWWERDSYSHSADSLYVSKSDSLSTYYIGCRCEVGMTGYLYIPWQVILSWKDRALLVAVVVGCILLFFVREYVSRVCRRLFMKKKPAVQTVIIEKEVPKVKEVTVFVEKIVPVIAGPECTPSIYQLEKGVYFDADSQRLEKGGGFVKLTLLPAKLLQGLLDAEGHRLSNDEIFPLLWPDGTGTVDRLHQHIKRLRNFLSQISACTIENENSAYRLKIPFSSEKILSE